MEYKEIVAVTGIGGLFQLLATKSDGAVVRSVADKTTKFISARKHNVTPLDSIEVYTIGDNVRLETVFLKMMEHHAWFISFAPVEKPQIALAVLVENGGHGGATAAPIARKVLDYYLLGKVPKPLGTVDEKAEVEHD